jgi:dTDP-4-amino-4,6-dideoxygalactose transaminase
VNVPFLDLTHQFAAIEDKLLIAFREVLHSQQFILGQTVENCEAALAQYCGSAFAIGVSSGTDALLMALMAEGVGPGDEVITTAYSFFATAGCISRVGATPVFVDIDPKTYNIDVDAVEDRITPRTRAIIPVHLFGQCADMDSILALAEKYHLIVIEDAAQAIGAEYRGRRAGTMGHYGCFSFFPSKNLGAAGDAGLVITNDPERAEKLRLLRSHGAKPKYVHHFVGGNFRMDAVQAAIISAKLDLLDAWTGARQRNAEQYIRLFEELCPHSVVPSDDRSQKPIPPLGIALPTILPNRRHVFNQFVIQVQKRDDLKVYLKEAGIGTEVYYPLPLHLQPCFRTLGYAGGSMPYAERAAKHSLALPIFPGLTYDQMHYVVSTISRFLEKERV